MGDATAPKPHVLVSVCKTSECKARGADALAARIGARVREAGIADRVKVQRGGCWGLCNLGPNVVVRQGDAAAAIERNIFGGDASFQGRVGEFHYPGCTPAVADRIVDEHLVAGKPIGELASDAAARAAAKKLSSD